jgi:hypothetical protein
MKWVFDDGGRAAAGFKGETGDCVTRAIAIATGHAYIDVYRHLNKIAESGRPTRGGKRSSARLGVFKKTYHQYLEALGAVWTPTMGIGTGCKVHLIDGELPMGRLIVKVSRHLTAVIDGVIHDTFDPQRKTVWYDGTDESGNPLVSHTSERCVYGYFTIPEFGER